MTSRQDQIYSQAATAVTATPARTAMPRGREPLILRNEGANAIYYRHNNSAVSAFLGATDAIVRALGGCAIKPGEKIVLHAVPWLDLVCLTGLTSTLAIDRGTLINA